MTASLFYHHPRLTILTVLLILVAGLAGWLSLPRQEDPALTGRFASVNTFFPGASARRVEALLTEKLENALEEVEEVQELISTSRTSVSVIQIELEESVRNVDEVWSRVRDKLKDVTPQLPAGATPPQFVRSYPVAETLLIGLTWTLDEELQLDLLYRLARDLRQRLQPLAGTREVELFGAPREEIRVTLDPAALAAVNLTITEVASIIAQADVKLPTGQVRGATHELIIEVGGELDSGDFL